MSLFARAIANDQSLDEVTEATRRQALELLRNRAGIARSMTAAQIEMVAQLASAEGTEDVGRPQALRNET